MGLNYTATYQNEAETASRIAKGTAYLLEHKGELVGTVLLKSDNWFTGRHTAYISQLAVTPAMKQRGLLMDLCEDIARRRGFEAIQLDTAKPAGHLVEWYKRRGYAIVGETQWEGKTYESWIFEKSLVN